MANFKVEFEVEGALTLLVGRVRAIKGKSSKQFSRVQQDLTKRALELLADRTGDPAYLSNSDYAAARRAGSAHHGGTYRPGSRATGRWFKAFKGRNITQKNQVGFGWPDVKVLDAVTSTGGSKGAWRMVEFGGTFAVPKGVWESLGRQRPELRRLPDGKYKAENVDFAQYPAFRPISKRSEHTATIPGKRFIRDAWEEIVPDRVPKLMDDLILENLSAYRRR